MKRKIIICSVVLFAAVAIFSASLSGCNTDPTAISRAFAEAIAGKLEKMGFDLGELEITDLDMEDINAFLTAYQTDGLGGAQEFLGKSGFLTGNVVSPSSVRRSIINFDKDITSTKVEFSGDYSIAIDKTKLKQGHKIKLYVNVQQGKAEDAPLLFVPVASKSLIDSDALMNMGDAGTTEYSVPVDAENAPFEADLDASSVTIEMGTAVWNEAPNDTLKDMYVHLSVFSLKEEISDDVIIGEAELIYDSVVPKATIGGEEQALKWGNVNFLTLSSEGNENISNNPKQVDLALPAFSVPRKVGTVKYRVGLGASLEENSDILYYSEILSSDSFSYTLNEFGEVETPNLPITLNIAALNAATSGDDSGNESGSMSGSISINELTGAAAIGTVLSAQMTGVPFGSYIIWQRSDSEDGEFNWIPWASDPSYTLSTADMNKWIRASVRNLGYPGASIDSPATKYLTSGAPLAE